MRRQALGLGIVGLLVAGVTVVAAQTAPRPEIAAADPPPPASATAAPSPLAARSAVASSIIGPTAPLPSATPPPTASAAPSSTPTSARTAIRPGSVNRSSLDLDATYDVRLRIGWSSRNVAVTTTIVVRNTSGSAVDRLELNTIAARLGRFRLTGTNVDGARVRASVSDQTIRVPLGGILEPGATTSIRVAYRATLRSTTSGSTWLFTRANGILEMHRWIPWISRATPFDRPNHGDPFVTPVSSRVRVTISADRRIAWATTGEQIGPTGTTTRFEATNVRDFAIVGAPDFRRTSTKVGGVSIRVSSRPGFPAATVLRAAKTALSREAALLGPYPYPTYELVQTAGGYGMESPGLTWIPSGAGSLGYLVAHETAHQWFYGIVGNDQARDPFADEAAADMVARNVLGLRRASRCPTTRLDLTIYRYSSACYYEVIYIQGGNVLDDVRRSMGSRAYWTAIRRYLADNRYNLSTTARLLRALDAGTRLDLRPRYHARFPSIY
jgi:hypothetical protein